MKVRHAVGWMLAAASILLLAASFTGEGRGVGDTGIMTHMAWSYLLGIGLLALIAWAAAGGPSTAARPEPSPPEKPQTPPAKESTESSE